MLDDSESLGCFAALLQLTNDAVFVWRFGGGIEIWNHGAEKLYGYKDLETIGHNCHDLLQTVFPYPWEEFESKLYLSGYWEGELLQRTKNGRVVMVSAKLQMIGNENGVDFILETNRDISECKKTKKSDQAQNLLRTDKEGSRNQSRLEMILATIPDPIFEFDNCGKVIMANQAALRSLGIMTLTFMRDETLAKLNFENLDGNPIKIEELPISRVLRGETIWGDLYTFRTFDGIVRVISVHAAPFYEDDKLVGAMMLCRFRSVLENSRDDINRFNLQTNHYKYISPSTEAVVGCLPEKITAIQPEKVVNLIHPNDLPTVQEAFMHLEKCGAAEAIYRQCTKIGEYRWIYNYMSLVSNNMSRLLCQNCNIYNGTGSRQVDEILWQSEACIKVAEVIEVERKRLLEVLETLPVMISLLTHDHRVAFANRSFRKRFGEFHGKRCYEYFHGRAEPCEFCESYRVFKTGKPHRWKIIHQDGNVLESHIFPFNDVDGSPMILEMNIDIGEQIKFQTALTEEREFLTITLNSLTEGVIATDPEGQIFLVNEAAVNLTGYSLAEAIGKPINKILYILDNQTSEPLLIPYMFQNLKQKTTRNLILVTRELREVAVAIQCSPIKSTESEIAGFVTVIQDVTEKQKVEQELLKVAKLDSIGILAGGLAHDFNNILAGIIANLQLASLKIKREQDITKNLEDTIGITYKASDLTKQLLTFAKGGAPVKKALFIANLVKDTVQFTLSGSNVKAEFNLSEDLWRVSIDEGQFVQVINNLTINAEQAMPIGGMLEVSGENLIIEESGKYLPGRYVKLTMKDQGIGIPNEIISNIFDPFFTTKKTGTGLGLSTSYSIIKKHDGYLEADSIPGKGSNFYILLPVSTEDLASKELPREVIISGKAKILLMDDEDTIRNVGGEMLTYYGYQVSLAKNGQEAITLYKNANATGEPFDIVIMDLTVPGGLGGIETMAILQQINPEIKAIISSGYASDPVMSEYEKYGFSGVVSKPYKFDDLVDILNKIICAKQLPPY